jgi:Homeodomain-like domain
MPSRYPVETRKQVVELARTGTRVAQLAETFGASEATIYNWLKRPNAAPIALYTAANTAAATTPGASPHDGEDDDAGKDAPHAHSAQTPDGCRLAGGSALVTR